MDRYINRENVRLFRERLLDPDFTPQQRETIERLLQEELRELQEDEDA
jgi:hypothetical protein